MLYGRHTRTFIFWQARLPDSTCGRFQMCRQRSDLQGSERIFQKRLIFEKEIHGRLGRAVLGYLTVGNIKTGDGEPVTSCREARKIIKWPNQTDFCFVFTAFSLKSFTNLDKTRRKNQRGLDFISVTHRWPFTLHKVCHCGLADSPFMRRRVRFASRALLNFAWSGWIR